MNMKTYEPREDSQLLAEAVRRHAFGRVLDMGTGTGIQAAAALKNRKVKSVTAADINKDCEKETRKISGRIKFVCSDLFEKIPKQEFDTIIFNPPYLPQDKGISDATIYGGKKGYEVIERFLGSCGSYLSNKGIILLLFSSLTNKKKVDEIIDGYAFEKEEAARQQLPMFETIYVYIIRKSRLLRELEKAGITGVKKFAQGRRGIIYAGILKGKKVAVKAKNTDSLAKNAVAKEAGWLKLLNKRGIGPKLASSGKDYFVAEFVEGRFIGEFVKDCSSKAKIAAVLKGILKQCRKMDELGINKEEMLRPHRHVIINSKDKAVMVDFERCRKTKKPKNVTQFCQFLISGYFSELLKQKRTEINREKLLEAAKNYKKTQTDEKLKAIAELIRH